MKAWAEQHLCLWQRTLSWRPLQWMSTHLLLDWTLVWLMYWQLLQKRIWISKRKEMFRVQNSLFSRGRNKWGLACVARVFVGCSAWWNSFPPFSYVKIGTRKIWEEGRGGEGREGSGEGPTKTLAAQATESWVLRVLKAFPSSPRPPSIHLNYFALTLSFAQKTPRKRLLRGLAT